MSIIRTTFLSYIVVQIRRFFSLQKKRNGRITPFSLHCFIEIYKQAFTTATPLFSDITSMQYILIERVVTYLIIKKWSVQISFLCYSFSSFLYILKIVCCDNMSAAEVFDEKSDMKSIVGSVVKEINCRVIVGWFLWTFPFKPMLLLSGLSILWSLKITFWSLMFWTWRLLVIT